MALSYSRILCRRTFEIHPFRALYTARPLNAATAKAAPVSMCESHDEKNQRLKRPLSPHLTIYQIQLTTALSITHRGTGIALATYAMALGLGTLFVPGGVPCIIDSIEALCLPLPILYAGKVLFAFPGTFHFFNGLRHLAWDLGKFLTIKEVYSTGYAVLGASMISALVLASL